MSVTFAGGVNSALQLAVAPELRGRVMALYSVVFVGSTPIGGPIAGWLSEAAGPRAGLVMGGVAAIVAGLVARRAFARGAAPAPAAPLEPAHRPAVAAHAARSRTAPDARVRRAGMEPAVTTERIDAVADALPGELAWARLGRRPARLVGRDRRRRGDRRAAARPRRGSPVARRRARPSGCCSRRPRGPVVPLVRARLPRGLL
jgi:MFS family permease